MPASQSTRSVDANLEWKEATMKFPNRAGTPLLAALAAATLAIPAFAATKTYIGTTAGHFNVAGNWSPSGAPAGGDDVILGTTTYTATDDLDVTLDTTEPTGGTSMYNSVTLDSTGLLGYMVLNQTAGALYATTETVGKTISENTFNQSGNTTNGALTMNIAMAGTNNSYNITSAGALLEVGVMSVGISGNGTFNQMNGTVYVGNTIFGPTGGITLAVNASSSGTYNLSNGNLGVLNIGFGNGNGVFTQTGGIAQANVIIVGADGTPGNAIFNDAGGTLTVIPEDVGGTPAPILIGGTGNGTFNLLTGGTLTANVTLYSQGIFDMNGGSIDAGANVQMAGGLFEVQGNNTAVTSLTIVSGTFQNGATSGTLTLNLPLIGGVVNTEPAGVVMKDGASGNFGLTIAGGAFALTTANTYSGNTTIQAGLLQALANNTLSPSSPVILTGGTLDLGAFTETIPSLAGTGGTVNINGSLTTGTNNLASSYAGTLTGNGTFSKTGSGTLTLAGGGSFTGTINIQGGITVGSLNGIPTGATLNLGLSAAASLNVNANQSLAVFSTGTLPTLTFANNATLTVGSGNINTTIDAAFSGAGSFVKAGTANLTLGFGSSDTVANTDTTLAIVVNSGTLLLNKATATTVIAGPLTINGGSVILTSSNQIAATSAVALTGGTLNLNSFNETFAGLSGSGGSILLGTGNLAIVQNTAGTSASTITGSGNITKSGSANLTLSGTNTGFTGGLTVSTGNLTLQGAINASSYSIANGALLLFSNATATLGSGALQPAAGAAVQYANATINGGFLRGPGTHTILAGGTSTFNGTATFNSTILTQNGPALFNDFTNGGTFNNSAALTLSGVVNSPTGIMNITTAVTAQDFDNEGILNIPTGASLYNSLSNLVLAGGSRTYIGTSANHGGSIVLTVGTTLEVNGALLVNDGTISGTTDVNYGGTAEGVGSYGPVNVSFGGTFQPGFASSGIVNNSATVTQLSGTGTIDNTSTGPMTLTLTGSSASTFSGPIQNSNGTTSLSIQGTSSLTLLTTPLANGSQSINTFTGGLSIASGGSVTIGAVGALPNASTIANNGAFSINANSTASTISGSGALILGTAAALTLAPNSGASKQSALSLTPTSQLNLTNNALILEAPDALTKSTDLTQLTAEVLSGKDGGAWDGHGITSSTAASNPNNISIAIADNAVLGYTTYGGQNVDPNSILVVPALFGDADLSGTVTVTDLNTVLTHLGTTTAAWTSGNFDNASTIDLTDLNDVLNHLGQSFAIPAAAQPALSAPEPTSLFLLVTAGATLSLLRKTRRNPSSL
jgi:fibronectin-binding autotransporter adhesin